MIYQIIDKQTSLPIKTPNGQACTFDTYKDAMTYMQTLVEPTITELNMPYFICTTNHSSYVKEYYYKYVRGNRAPNELYNNYLMVERKEDYDAGYTHGGLYSLPDGEIMNLLESLHLSQMLENAFYHVNYQDHHTLLDIPMIESAIEQHPYLRFIPYPTTT